MMPRKYYMIEGQRLSREEAEAKYGLKLPNLLARIERGIPLDTPIRKSGRRVAVEYEGKTFRSITSLALEFDIEPATLAERIRAGMTAHEAVTAILAKRERKHPRGYQPTSPNLEGTGAGSRLVERGDLKLPNETENEVT